jgi:hypothetical protein
MRLVNDGADVLLIKQTKRTGAAIKPPRSIR